MLFGIQGAGVGLADAGRDRRGHGRAAQGAGRRGSALTNTARQVAVALGVAVLGSILAQSYRVARCPRRWLSCRLAARDAAGQSITATQAVAGHLGHAGQFLLDPANVAFVDAMRITTLVAAGIAVLGGLVVMRWMPGRQGLTSKNWSPRKWRRPSGSSRPNASCPKGTEVTNDAHAS